MVKSMTGYGRGELSFEDGVQLTVELRAVNNRYLDCTVKMPRAYIFAEDAMKARVQKSAVRGKVDIFVTIVRGCGDDMVVTVNEELAKSYIDALYRLHNLGGGKVRREYYATDLARFPDVLTVEKAEEDPEQMKGRLLSVLDLALEDFNAMRTTEGGRLAEDVLGRADTIEKLLGEVEERSPQTVNDYRTRLEAKMREVLQNTQIDEARLLTEAAIFAMRTTKPPLPPQNRLTVRFQRPKGKQYARLPFLGLSLYALLGLGQFFAGRFSLYLGRKGTGGHLPDGQGHRLLFQRFTRYLCLTGQLSGPAGHQVHQHIPAGHLAQQFLNGWIKQHIYHSFQFALSLPGGQ